MKRQYITYMQCKGGCGKRLATGIRLGTAAMRRKYAGYCDDCMTPEMQKAMEAESTTHMLRKAS